MTGFGPVATAVVAGLESAGLLVGDGVKPPGAGWQGAEGDSPFIGYCIVYPLSSMLDGPLSDVNADAAVGIQVTSIGATREAAADVADTANSWLLNQGRMTLILGTAVRVMNVAWQGGGDVRRDDTTIPPLFYAPSRFSISTTPT